MAKTKGAIQYTTRELQQKLQELGCDVATMLAFFAMGDHEALKYDSQYIETVTSKGDVIKRHIITPDMRLTALKILSEYLYPKRKAVEHSGEITNVIEEKLSTKDIEVILRDDPFLTTTGKAIEQLPS